MNYRQLFILALSIPALTTIEIRGQAKSPAPPSVARPARTVPTGGLRTTNIPPKKTEDQLQSFKFEGADLDTVMTQYCEWTDQIYLKTDAVKASISIKADKITIAESIELIESILAQNQIALIQYENNRIKVVPANQGDLTGQGLPIGMNSEQESGNPDEFMTERIQLQNVTIAEVQTAVQHVLHSYGKILTLERSNTIVITDTRANIERARGLIKYIDQATAKIEQLIYKIEYAEASEIASKLNEIITAAQGDQKKPVVTGTPYKKTPPGVIRAGRLPPAAPSKATITKTEGVDDVIIQGTVKVMADERTNIIIIFSQEENFPFFDKIIKVLDVEVEPEFDFERIFLEYADAEELAGTLNELISATSGTSSSSSSGSSRKSGTSNSRPSSTSSRSTNPSNKITPNAAPSSGSTIQNMSRFSEETKILADKRTNAILFTGRKEEIVALTKIIKSLDIMLEQVVIEAAIFEIGLDDNLQHGIDWIYKNKDNSKIGAWDGKSILTNSPANVVSGALSYFIKAPGINSEFLINLTKTDTSARLISTPLIVTMDNTEASLTIGEQRPVVTSTSSFANSSGTQSSQYEYKDIGIQLTVTPRINPQRFVVMELTQKADQLGGNIEIDGNQVPIIKNREFNAFITVPDGGTAVLGGLISTETADTINKIPLLGDIPLLGRYIFSSVNKVETQRELIVLLTPYVMTNQEEMSKQTERLYKRSSLEQEDWKNSWSDSKIRDIPDPVDTNAEGYEAPASSENTTESTELDLSTSSTENSENSETHKLMNSMNN